MNNTGNYAVSITPKGTNRLGQRIPVVECECTCGESVERDTMESGREWLIEHQRGHRAVPD